MRLGQSVADVVQLTSDPEIKLHIVPLSDAEFMQVLEAVASMSAPPDFTGMQMRDRKHAQETIVRAIREPDDFSERVYAEVSDMMEDFDATDVDDIYLRYQEMTAKSSPSLDEIPPEELETVKKALQEMDWSELSGRSWFALKHFLGTIMPSPLLDSLPGSGSTKLSITTNE